MVHKFSLFKYGDKLWTRDVARKVRTDLYQVIEKASDGDVIVMDLKGVEVFDFSFANELFGKTLYSLPVEFPGRFVVFDHLTPYTRENLVNALEGMKLMAIARRGSATELIGKAHPTDIETFNALSNMRKPSTAAALADAFRVNLTAMHERLNKLVEAGVMRREASKSAAGRVQFVYAIPS
jgi:hypothetical protein